MSSLRDFIYIINVLNDQDESLASVGPTIEDVKVFVRVGKWEFSNVRRQAKLLIGWLEKKILI